MGQAREIACFGARGDGKSWGALWGMVMHAVEHHRAGHPLPIQALGVRDTFANHKLSTHKTLLEPAWDGRWRLSDGGHNATYALDGVPFVSLDLVGADTASDVERLRTQCHLLWFEEAAPAMALSQGLAEDFWGLGMSSQRLMTHARVAVLTTNYPDEEHWTWQRFVAQPQPGTMAFRIPPGERASKEYRDELERAYANRPDLRRRLLEGRPGTIILGEQVAVGFNEDVHVGRVKLEPGVKVVLGQDGGLTPTTVIGQRLGPYAKIGGSVATEHGGIRQHVKYLLRPWLQEHAPWCLKNRDLLDVYFDPSMNKDGEGDSEANALRIMRAELIGHYHPGAVGWEARKNPMLASFGGLVGGRPVVTVDPVLARGLVKALTGGWHYPTDASGRVRRDDPVKDHPHSDHGDAYCYFIGGVNPGKQEQPKGWKPGKPTIDFTPLDYVTSGRGAKEVHRSRIDFEVWR